MYLVYFFLIFTFNLYIIECNDIVDNVYTPNYHLRPPYGWMNDPNGFCRFGGLYHLFYQHNPYSSFEPGIAHWRHATSSDLMHWNDRGIILYPDQWYDQTGVFSGSALVENNTMYIYYTGNVKYPRETPDHIQHQALAISTDGINFVKYEGNPIITGSTQLPNIRDPKVWKKGETYYMVLGVSLSNNTVGAIRLYASNDKVSWQQVSTLIESESLGFMCECPDFIELDGYFVIIFSPQKIDEKQENESKIWYRTGYIVGTFDYTSYVFNNLTDFRVLDSGHDFYATQTTLDENGNRIMIAWLDMWERNYTERYYGFTGQMTLPRKLSITESLTILQAPVKEVANVRGNKIYHDICKRKDVEVTLNNNSAVIYIKANRLFDFELHIDSRNSSTNVVMRYDAKNKYLILNRGGKDGIRRTNWKPVGMLRWTVFIDSSSIELFAGEGEVTMSSRTFPTGPVQVRLGKGSVAKEIQIYNMKRSVYLNDNKRQ